MTSKIETCSSSLKSIELSDSKNDTESKTTKDLSSTPSEVSTKWSSIFVVVLVAFLLAVEFSIYISSIWPFLKINDDSTTETFFGVVFASYYTGQFIFSPIIGYWSNKIKQTRLPLLFCTLLNLVGDAIYMTLVLWKPYQNCVILFGRFFNGVASSDFSLLRAYIATACNKKDLSRSIAMINGAFALGYAVGPALQVAVTKIGYPGYQVYGGFYMNLYTAPAAIAVLIDLLCFPLIGIFFKEEYARLVEVKPTSKDEKETIKLPNPDFIATCLCYFTRFTFMFVYQNITVLNSLLATSIFAFTKTQVVQVTALAQTFYNGLCFACYLFLIAINVSKYINNRILTIAMLGTFFLFHFITFPWPFLPGEVITYSNSDVKNSTSEMVGCNIDQLSWCHDASPINAWVYFGSFVVLIGIAYSFSTVSLGTLFTEILGPRRQGTQQGIYQVSGGLGKMVGPVIAGWLFTHMGLEIVWYMEFLVLIIPGLLIVMFYKRMVLFDEEFNSKN